MPGSRSRLLDSKGSWPQCGLGAHRCIPRNAGGGSVLVLDLADGHFSRILGPSGQRFSLAGAEDADGELIESSCLD